ncbi:MAG: HAMP domain-containing histidine kinase [Lachnospiraceae bacterium]
MKYSLRIKLAVILFVIVAGAILGNWFINMVFQEKYYISMKENDLIDFYTLMCRTINEGERVDEKSRMEMVSVCEEDSITILVVDSGLEVKFYSGYSIMNDSLIERLKNILFYQNTDFGELIAHTENYVMSRIFDEESGHNYLEMYGNLDSGDIFVMRTSIDSIKAALGVTNQFTAYVGGMVIAISLICVLMLSIGITARIEKLAHISTEMSKLNFNIKYHDERKDEISMLGSNLNVLSERLEATISELKTANNELQKDIQKKEEIDEMRKEFLSNVSHELKTPIAIIQGYAEGLKESVNDDEQSRDFYCDVIIDEALKMNRMVQKLLTLNHLEFGTNTVEMERFDLITVIDYVLNRARVLIEERNAQVIFNNKKQVFVWADEFQIEEVITNYISNALNHLNGEKIIKIDVEEKDDIVKCTVFNTGENIPESDIDKIWEKFYKVDKARTREYGGSGIGLSIVKAILAAMNRECGVKNVQNGVEFWFEVEKCIENANI